MRRGGTKPKIAKAASEFLFMPSTATPTAASTTTIHEFAFFRIISSALLFQVLFLSVIWGGVLFSRYIPTTTIPIQICFSLFGHESITLRRFDLDTYHYNTGFSLHLPAPHYIITHCLRRSLDDERDVEESSTLPDTSVLVSPPPTDSTSTSHYLQPNYRLYLTSSLWNHLSKTRIQF